MVLLNEGPPLIRRRVLYIGSSVPRETAVGLEAIQQPLKDRYPVNDDSNIEGIDSELSIFEDCIQMQYVSDPNQVVTFPITTLTLCAAVRCVTTINGATGEKGAEFVSLTNPAAGGQNSDRPSIFAAITRRTQGRKVLECHGFICASAKDAMELVKAVTLAGNHARGSSPLVIENHSPAVNGSFDRAEPTQTSLGQALSRGPSIRLVPGEQVIQDASAGPEFFEPVPSQGYFYSSDKTEIKKFNISKLNIEHEVKRIPTRILKTPRSVYDLPPIVQTNGAAPMMGRESVIHLADQPNVTHHVMEQPRVIRHVVEQPQITRHVVEQQQVAHHVVEQPQVTRHVMEQPQVTRHVMEQPQVTRHVMEQPQVTRHVVEQPQVIRRVVEQPQIIRHVVEQPNVIHVESPRYVHMEPPHVHPRLVRVDAAHAIPERIVTSQTGVIPHPPQPQAPEQATSIINQTQTVPPVSSVPPAPPNSTPQLKVVPHAYIQHSPPYVAQPPPPPLVRPVYIPVPVVQRPRFFSPPPDMRRPYPPPPPPPPPPPMGMPFHPVFGPPVVIRRRRSKSRESSASRSSSESGSSKDTSKNLRAPSRREENTNPKVVNDADSLSESASRPKTPPRDYGGRLSRKDAYEKSYYRKLSPLRERNVYLHPHVTSQYPYDYVYWRGGPGYMPYPPFMNPPPMRGAPFRSRSVPPAMRGYVDNEHRRKKSGKGKKKKRISKKFHNAPSDISTDSYAAGYHSDINVPQMRDGYQFYPPRDFRRKEKQFMNERSFSKSIAEQYRQTRDTKHQSAYELNEAVNGMVPDEEFKMY